MWALMQLSFVEKAFQFLDVVLSSTLVNLRVTTFLNYHLNSVM